MVSSYHLQHQKPLAQGNTKVFARTLINQIITEFNVAKAKLEHSNGLVNTSEIMQSLQEIECQIVNINRQMQPLPAEQESYHRHDDQEFHSFLNTLWGSD